MKNKLSFLLLSVILLSCGKSYKGDIIISNINVVDVETEKVIPSQTVIINNNKIDTILAFNPKATLLADQEIDGTNKFLTPGLWDMHTHVLWSWPEYRIHNAMMIANGITGFRDMWGSDSIARIVKNKYHSKELPTQRFYRANEMLDGSPRTWEGSAEVTSPEEAIKLVDSLFYKTDADFIKVYGKLDKETFYAIADRCKELNVDFMGHVPAKLSLEEAVKAGMRSVEHMLKMQLAFSTAKDSLYKIIDSIPSDPLFVLNTQSNESLDSMVAMFKKYNCAVVPTIITYQGQERMLNSEVIDPDNPRSNFIPASCKENWEKGMPPSPLPPFILKLIKDSNNRNIELAGLLYKKGVTVLAGSDVACSNAFTYSGYSLHDEFQNFINAGLSPGDILKIATIDATRFVKMNDSLGLVKPGYLADLLILNDNPLVDVKNLQNIESVISNGDLHNRQALIDLQNSAKERAKTISERGGN